MSDDYLGLMQVSRLLKVPYWKILYAEAAGRIPEPLRIALKRAYTERDIEIIREYFWRKQNDGNDNAVRALQGYIEPLHLSFEDGKYRYLGAGKDGATARQENKAVVVMAKIVSRLADGPLSGVEMIDAGIAGKHTLYAACRVLKDQGVIVESGKKHALSTDWMGQWQRYCSSLGVKDGTAGVDQVEE